MSVRDHARQVVTDPPRLVERHQRRLRQIRHPPRDPVHDLRDKPELRTTHLLDREPPLDRFPNFAHRSWPSTMPEWVGVQYTSGRSSQP